MGRGKWNFGAQRCASENLGLRVSSRAETNPEVAQFRTMALWPGIAVLRDAGEWVVGAQGLEPWTR